MTGSAIIEKSPAEGKVLSLRQLRSDFSQGAHQGRTLDELWKLVRYIEAHDEPYLPFPLIDGMGIHPDEVHWRPICESCHRKLKRTSKRLWSCESCNRVTADPFTRTLEDWFLLRSRTLNNRQARELFGISSQSVSRILMEYPLSKGGRNRSTHYTWDYRTPLVRKTSARERMLSNSR